MKKRRQSKTSLESWLNSVTTPVFLLNARRQVVFFNAGLETLTGWTAADVVGQVCNYATNNDPSTVELLTGTLCPPPDVWEGQLASVPAYVPLRTGRILARLLQFFPLTGAEGRVESVLGIVTSIDEPIRAAEATPAQQLHAELASVRNLLRQRFGVKTFVCQSEAMTRVLEQVELARQSDVPVLIHGEPGTGKEHVARSIHHESNARSRSFVPIDCRALPALDLKQTLRRLLESDDDEAAMPPNLQPGTAYLSNVESLPRDLQQQLVTAFRGDQTGRRAKLRLLASSTTNMRRAVEQETIRSDLFYLLTPMEIEIPPLRRRPEDVPMLAQHFLESLNRDHDQQAGGFDEVVWEQFAEYNWPGNVDELAAVVAEARLAAEGGLIRVEHLPFRFRTGLDAQAVGPVIEPEPVPLEPLLKRVESEQIRLALEKCRHNISKAAAVLGMTRARLYRRMQTLGIENHERKG